MCSKYPVCTFRNRSLSVWQKGRKRHKERVRMFELSAYRIAHLKADTRGICVDRTRVETYCAYGKILIGHEAVTKLNNQESRSYL